MMLADTGLGLLYDSPDKGLLIGVAGSVFVKGAVGADPMTEGDVNVDNQKMKTVTLSV